MSSKQPVEGEEGGRGAGDKEETEGVRVEDYQIDPSEEKHAYKDNYWFLTKELSVVVEPVEMLDPPTPDTKVGVVIDPSGGVTKKTYGKGEKKTEYLIVDGFYLNPTYYKDWAQMSYWTPHPVITAKWIENKTADSKKRKCWLGCSLLVLSLDLINKELEKSGKKKGGKGKEKGKGKAKTKTTTKPKPKQKKRKKGKGTILIAY
jgi:hypothetical protein